MNESDSQDAVYNKLPHLIATRYRRILDAADARDRVGTIIDTYNLLLHLIAIVLVSQYLVRDREEVVDPYLNDLLLNRFPHLTTDEWEKITFAALRAYEDKRDLLFMPELYDMYWDQTSLPNQPRINAQAAFDRLTQATIELHMSRNVPHDEIGWQQLAHELEDRLREVLTNTAFLGEYDLIRVVDYDDRTFSFELHKGLDVTIQTRPYPQQIELNRGWFYLRSAHEDYLLLHPLLILWQETVEPQLTTGLTDTGVYNRFTLERLQYVLSEAGTLVTDTNHFHQFVELLYGTIEDIKRQKIQSEALTWPQLSDLCVEISEQRASTLYSKYDVHVHLPRERLLADLQDFIASNRRCFVLLGPSGVGKSSALVELERVLAKSRQDICMLMYDGATLNLVDSITAIITRDFSHHLQLRERPLSDIWDEIAHMTDIQDRTVLLCIDAINENPQASSLLRQLDDLVQSPWPWLKTIITSRPETWRSIRRSAKLSSRFYYRASTDEDEMEDPDSFDHSAELEPFDREEAERAYGKYKVKYQIVTEYHDITPAVRQSLQDPLNLWLVARTYRGRVIPPGLRVSTLVSEYVDASIRSGLLRADDVRFLERRLVPLMTQQGHYTNFITAADLDDAGDNLYDIVFSDAMLSDGQRLNDGFRNLVDTSILVRQTDRQGERIAFQYERFYEYFVGKRLLHLSNEEQDRASFFTELVDQTTQTPFLWGAIRLALIEDAGKRGIDLITNMCFTDQARVQNMMTDTLVGLSTDREDLILLALPRLLPKLAKTTNLFLLRRLMAKTPQTFNLRSLNASRVAVDVAVALNISDILINACLQPDALIRQSATYGVWRLWRRDAGAGLTILENIGHTAVDHLIPNPDAFETTLALSLLVFFEGSSDSQTQPRLQELWRFIIGRVLAINESSGPLNRTFRSFVRERLFSLVITIGFRMLSDFSESTVISYEAIKAFTGRTLAEKALYRRMVSYLDVEGGQSAADVRADFSASVGIHDELFMPVAALVLSARVGYNLADGLALARHVLAASLAEKQPTAWVSIVPISLTAVLDHHPDNTEVFSFFLDSMRACQEYFGDPRRRPVLKTTESVDAMYLGPAIAYQFRRSGNVNADWLQTCIDTALRNGSVGFFESLLNSHLRLVGIELGMVQAALDTIALFWARRTPPIEDLLVSFLARLRLAEPDTVDAFLEDQHAPSDLRLRVQTSLPIVSAGDLLGLRTYKFVRDDIVLGNPPLRDRFIHILSRAADAKDARVWADYLIREVVNLVYEGKALRQRRTI